MNNSNNELFFSFLSINSSIHAFRTLEFILNKVFLFVSALPRFIMAEVYGFNGVVGTNAVTPNRNIGVVGGNSYIPLGVPISYVGLPGPGVPQMISNMPIPANLCYVQPNNLQSTEYRRVPQYATFCAAPPSFASTEGRSDDKSMMTSLVFNSSQSKGSGNQGWGSDSYSKYTLSSVLINEKGGEIKSTSGPMAWVNHDGKWEPLVL